MSQWVQTGPGYVNIETGAHVTVEQVSGAWYIRVGPSGQIYLEGTYASEAATRDAIRQLTGGVLAADLL
jgi:hypothetical protein